MHELRSDVRQVKHIQGVVKVAEKIQETMQC